MTGSLENPLADLELVSPSNVLGNRIHDYELELIEKKLGLAGQYWARPLPRGIFGLWRIEVSDELFKRITEICD